MYKIDKFFAYIAISDHQQQNEYAKRPNRTHYFNSIENTGTQRDLLRFI